MTTEFFSGNSSSSTPLKAQENSPLIVAAAIFHPGADGLPLLLAAERSYPENLAGKWEFPGGKVEEGESPEEALHREIREELGISIQLEHLIPGPHHGDWLLPNGSPMRLWAARLRQISQDSIHVSQDPHHFSHDSLPISHDPCRTAQDSHHTPCTPQDPCLAAQNQHHTSQNQSEAHDSYEKTCENTPPPQDSLRALPQAGSSHSSLRWLGVSELESIPWLPGDLQILPSIRSLLES